MALRGGHARCTRTRKHRLMMIFLRKRNGCHAYTHSPCSHRTCRIKKLMAASLGTFFLDHSTCSKQTGAPCVPWELRRIKSQVMWQLIIPLHVTGTKLFSSGLPLCDLVTPMASLVTLACIRYSSRCVYLYLFDVMLVSAVVLFASYNHIWGHQLKWWPRL